MTSNGLWDKMHAAARNYRLDCLDKFGIKPNHAIAAGGLGVAKISLISNGFFEFGGELSAVILPVYWGAIPTEEALVPDWELEDILAFNPNEPEKWWMRTGGAPLLGAGALSDQLLGKPLHVYRTPLSWLKGGCDGVVLLDLNRAFVDLVTAPNGLSAKMAPTPMNCAG